VYLEASLVELLLYVVQGVLSGVGGGDNNRSGRDHLAGGLGLPIFRLCLGLQFDRYRGRQGGARLRHAGHWKQVLVNIVTLTKNSS